MTFGSNRPPEPQGRPVPRPPFQQSPPTPGPPRPAGPPARSGPPIVPTGAPNPPQSQPHQPIAPPPNPDAVPTTGFRIPTPPPAPPGSPPQPDLEPKLSRKRRRQDKKREKPERQLSAAAADQAPKTGFFRSRRGAFLRWTALVVGLLLIGWSAGYLLMPRSATEQAIVIPKEAFQATATSGEMPSLVGLNRDTALAALGDAGISGMTIKYSEKPGAGTPGTVMEQQPSAGVQVTKNIQLTLSTPVAMPDVIGTPNRDARAAIEDLGAVVSIETVVDPAAKAGAVIRTDPVAGQTTPNSVRLYVADPGDALSLSTVSTVSSSSCSTSSSTSVSGTTLSNNVTCSPRKSSPASVEYAVSRHATALEATVGTGDSAGTGRARITIIGDGKPLKTVEASFGKSEEIRVDLSGVMRLRIEVSTNDDDNAPTVVLGDARLRGATDGLDQIAGQR